ncbi:cell wall hydrolase [Aquibacillus koreensis]|uniref:Cell wall hydrolase n=1 Tax=Aquibacillus koreensis TaxID=279446 RepID=A0A9X3WPD8_9BACI|nr:cell wall hydrolase [Aquibacillus koreensis]MCT2535145.1 cell wall hydrolase [Aquibacillus koreensis]MDC3421004.1 cell wall hydrolase [Aquibacillus koreensis]
MNTKKVLLLITIALVSVLTLPNITSAASQIEEHEASFIETIFTQQANHHVGSLVEPDQKVMIEHSVSEKEKELMEKIVQAEAKGEPYEGKVAVATVILNRVDHPDFPDSIEKVIYQKLGQIYAFSPVQNGMINNQPSTEAKQAVREALDQGSKGHDAVYFYNPKTAQDKWIFSRTVIKTIGNHTFAK